VALTAYSTSHERQLHNGDHLGHRCLRRRRSLHHSLPPLLINQRKPKSALRLNERLRLRRLHYQRSKKTRLFRLRSIIADPVPTSGSFEETVAGFQHRHWLVIHLVEDGASEDVYGCGSTMVGVRWCAGAGRESDFEADDALVGGIGELVSVH